MALKPKDFWVEFHIKFSKFQESVDKTNAHIKDKKADDKEFFAWLFDNGMVRAWNASDGNGGVLPLEVASLDEMDVTERQLLVLAWFDKLKLQDLPKD